MAGSLSTFERAPVVDAVRRRAVPRARRPTSYPSGRFSMNSWACARLAARSMSPSVASKVPYRMFSATVPKKRNGSWLTYPIERRRLRSVTSRTSCPSIRTAPSSASYRRGSSFNSVDLPAPVGPTTLTVVPFDRKVDVGEHGPTRVAELYVVVRHGTFVDRERAASGRSRTAGSREHALDSTAGGLGSLVVVDHVAQPDDRPEELLGVDHEGDERPGVSAPSDRTPGDRAPRARRRGR